MDIVVVIVIITVITIFIFIVYLYFYFIFKLAFTGTVGPGYRDDIALDDFLFVPGDCIGKTRLLKGSV